MPRLFALPAADRDEDEYVQSPEPDLSTVKTVEAHVKRIFRKLGVEESPDDHRRVLAVLAFLRS